MREIAGARVLPAEDKSCQANRLMSRLKLSLSLDCSAAEERNSALRGYDYFIHEREKLTITHRPMGNLIFIRIHFADFENHFWRISDINLLLSFVVHKVHHL